MVDNVQANPGAGGAVFASDDIGGVQYPRFKLGVGPDGTAVDVGSLSTGTGLQGVLTAKGATEFFFSTLNASTTQLLSGTFFTGTIEPILAGESFILNISSDQPGTATVKQFIDAAGTRQAGPDLVYTHAAGVGLNLSTTSAGNYFRLLYQNTGGSTTTTLNINTAFGGLSAVTNRGNAPVSLNEVNGVALNIGQTTAANSLPVVLASNQPNVPINLAQVNGATISLGQQSQANSLPVSLPNDLTVGAAASIAALNVDLLTGGASGWYDAAAFHSCSIQIVGGAGISAGAIFFEQTNDTTAAAAGNIWPVEEDTSLTPTPNIAAITIAASTIRMFRGAVTSRYVRVRVSTAFAGGTVQAIGVFSEVPFTRLTQTVHQATAGNLNCTATIASGTVTTVTTCSTLTTLANGQTAHSSASTGSPVRVGGRVVSTLDTTLVQGDASDLAVTTGQQLVTKDFASSENDWQSFQTLTTNTAAAAKAAGAASIRNFCTQATVQNTNAVATTFLILDGATTLFQVSLPASMTLPVQFQFPTPLRGTAATAMNVNCGTTGANVLCNITGYQSF